MAGRVSRVVLDTSALLYWTLSPDQLPKAAKRAIAAAESEEGVLASAISLWEIGLKAQRGTLSLGVPFEEYVRRLQRVASLTLVPADVRVWLRVLELDWAHRDPADRVIVATAELHDLPLVSSDAEIRRFYAGAVWS